MMNVLENDSIFFSTIASVLIDEKEFDFHSLHVHVHNTVIARCMTVMK